MRRTWQWFGVWTVTVAAGFAYAVAHADVWSTAGFDQRPGVNDPVSQGDDEIRLTRSQARGRLDVEHHFGTAVDADDNGTHRLGSARCFIGTAPPTDLEVADFNNSGGAGTTSLAATATNSAPAEVLGLGRCWVDTDGADGVSGTGDDGALYYYSGTAWVLASARNNSANIGAGLVNAGAYNLLFNGSFEENSLGATSAPDGWADTASTTIGYVTTDITEGVGNAVSITGNGGAAKGITQSLAGLKKSTSYYVVARVKPSAGDTCSLVTTGGTVLTNLNAVSVGTAAFETLSGNVKTSATPDPVVIKLLSTLDTDVCVWDHVAVYERNSEAVSQPGSVVQYACTTANTALTNDFTVAPNPVLTQQITVPGPGYYIRITANASALTALSNTMQLDARIREDAGTVVDQRSQGVAGNGITTSVSLNYINPTPTPGWTYTYTLEMAENAGQNQNLRMAAAADLSTSCMSVELIPVR